MSRIAKYGRAAKKTAVQIKDDLKSAVASAGSTAYWSAVIMKDLIFRKRERVTKSRTEHENETDSI